MGTHHAFILMRGLTFRLTHINGREALHCKYWHIITFALYNFTAIHIIAHLVNIERYHLSQSKHAGELSNKLSTIGRIPNESYVNPIQDYDTVSWLCCCWLVHSTASFIEHTSVRAHTQSKAVKQQFTDQYGISISWQWGELSSDDWGSEKLVRNLCVPKRTCNISFLYL